MSRWNFTKGLHDIGNDCYAYLQPDGGWGLANSGLICDGGESMLVDTLIDLPLTREMLAAMRAANPAANQIKQLLNTHSHPDHTNGNELVEGAEIIASAAAALEMRQMAEGHDPIADIMQNWEKFGEGGAFLHETMGSKFEIGKNRRTVPTRTFETTLTLAVGEKQVHLTKLGPAHTRGDVIAHLPAERIVFTGDILFHEVHPSVLAEPVSGWLAACDHILALDVDVVIPGHGPIADLAAVKRLQDYLRYFQTEARKRFDAGMAYEEAAKDMTFDAFRGWADEERILITLANFYKEFGGVVPPMPEVMAMCYRYRRNRMAHNCNTAGCADPAHRR